LSSYRSLNRPILVEDYDPRWPVWFEAEKGRLLMVLGALSQKIVAIEHFGSTAVPGLSAKPVIDIALGFEKFAETEPCLPLLETAGYTYVPALEVALPGRRFFWRGTAQIHTHHLHLTEITSPLWGRPMRFRDYLRGHPEAALAYGQLKRELARKVVDDIDAYVAGKTAFVEEILWKAGSLANQINI
jgi:GrpB-like predicted nucleotidyltransferase (UPF0157 family)